MKVQFRLATLLVGVLVMGIALAWINASPPDPIIVGDWIYAPKALNDPTFARILAERNGKLSIMTFTLASEIELYGTWNRLSDGKYEFLIERQFEGDSDWKKGFACERRFLLRCGVCENGCLMVDNVLNGYSKIDDESSAEMTPLDIVIPSNYWVPQEKGSPSRNSDFKHKNVTPEQE